MRGRGGPPRPLNSDCTKYTFQQPTADMTSTSSKAYHSVRRLLERCGGEGVGVSSASGVVRRGSLGLNLTRRQEAPPLAANTHTHTCLHVTIQLALEVPLLPTQDIHEFTDD